MAVISERLHPIRQVFTSGRLLAVLLLSFSSGLPLMLTGSTLQAWYTKAGVDIVSIGMLSLIGFPYVFKFLWAPLLDRFAPLSMGRRKGWIFLMQLFLVAGIIAMAYLAPTGSGHLLAFAAVMVALFSATQDTAINAYSADVLTAEERGLGAACISLGYRMAMLVSGALALILGAEIGWHWTYMLMALIVLVFAVVTLFSPKPVQDARPPTTMRASIVEPLKEFLSRPYAWMLLVLIVLYKFSDAFTLSLNTTFLLRGLHFTLVDLGSVVKIVGVTATLLGCFLGGVLMPKLGLYKSLLIFGIIQTFAALAYMLLAMVGHHYSMMVFAIFSENFCSGMGSVAFIGLLMALCDRRYTAFQYAIFSAVMAIGRVFIGPFSGELAKHAGWTMFFFWTFVSGFPAIMILMWLKKKVNFDAEWVR